MGWSRPWQDNNNSSDNMPNGSVNEDVYSTNNQYILTNHYKPDHALNRYYNFPINRAVSDQVIVHQMQYSYRRQ